MGNALRQSCLGAFVLSLISAVVGASETAASEGKLTPACMAAKLYMERIEARDVDGVRDLFSENATYTGPDGVTVYELEKIRASYERGLTNPRSSSWHFRMENLLPFGKNGCLLEFATSFEPGGEYTLAAVDRIEVNDQGKITRFLPYIASDNMKRIAAYVQNKTETQQSKP